MEVGDYVRTKNGISKVKEIHDVVTTDNEYITTLISHDNGTCSEENVIKYSQNIIDLIEVGDYVNGYYVEDIRHRYDGEMITILEVATGSNYFQTPMYEDDIKSIVTREQFEAMQYKVGD